MLRPRTDAQRARQRLRSAAGRRGAHPRPRGCRTHSRGDPHWRARRARLAMPAPGLLGRVASRRAATLCALLRSQRQARRVPPCPDPGQGLVQVRAWRRRRGSAVRRSARRPPGPDPGQTLVQLRAHERWQPATGRRGCRGGSGAAPQRRAASGAPGGRGKAAVCRHRLARHGGALPPRRSATLRMRRPRERRMPCRSGPFESLRARCAW